MPWDKKDFPRSLKNLDPAIRNKAIDIANAMVDEGYEEERAIPIATTQAKEWYDNATEDEVNRVHQISNEELRARGEGDVNSRPELIKKREHVVVHEGGWAVKTQDAKKASNIFDTKEEAVDRAKEIAKNKGTGVVIHKQNGEIQEQRDYS
ncbi:hypothetical protein GCM10011351_26330 [Paraliobacillus quinghaiensis]|uniref:DUF2188 domain-containing protein n=1 Tax=Paraliobacillus quinghaiensis TaxID=470815 RepID=A0A917TV45_9BACI|nr:DUF2188 domain-containing protein [Paraliobacillus quinghaiensis]GGM38909.1 hypothetical protein GCM10011351_26330 [Paraliobacillus quinghaiensis]